MKLTKTTIILSAVILALGVTISWQDYQQLAAARVSQSQLAAQLAVVESRFELSQQEKNVEITKHQREKKKENHHESSSDLIALIREISANFESSGELDPTALAKLKDFEIRLKSLDAAQWRNFLVEIQAGKVFQEYGNANVIHSSILMQMGSYFRDSDQPQNLLTLSVEFKDLFKDNEKSLAGMATCLLLWTKKDPTAAVAWLRKNHLTFSGLADNNNVSNEMISIVAMKNPLVAFQLIDELGIEDRNDSVSYIGQCAENVENRTAILAALHHYVSGLPEGEERDHALNAGVIGLMESAMMQGFEVGTEWISHVGITPDQYILVFDKLAKNGSGFLGVSQWIDWLIPHLPQEQVAEKVSDLVTSWVKEDYKSAGEWISHNANGLVKNAAIHAYSYEVAAYEPTVAAQWAMTLPAGENRKKALEGVYENWLKTDAAGKEAFGKQHGFE
jgi:hypothetical protein